MTRTRDYAVAKAQNDVAEWTRQNGCPSALTALDHAIRDGNSEVVRSLIDNTAIMLATSNGHLEVLQWACENGMHWNAQPARNDGHLDILRWARENGAHWSINH